MNKNHCSICLKLSNSTRNIKEQDENNINICAKLKTIAPALEWLDQYLICEICNNLLNEAYNFRQLCYNLDSQRKAIIFESENEQKQESVADDIVDILQSDEDTSRLENETTQYNSPEVIEVSDNIREQAIKEEVLNSFNLKCYHCTKTFKRKENLIKHIRTSHNIVCNICKKVFNDLKVLINHMKDIHCEGNETESNHDINDYLKVQLDVNAVKEASNIFFQIDKKETRQNTNRFSCEVCNKTFAFLKSLLDHCTNVHQMNKSDIKPYSCKLCNKRLSSSANLIQHKNYHEGNRTHICSFCGKTFITKSDLTVHEYIHLNRRNYKCVICSKTFNTNKTLRSHHLVVHTDSSLWKYGCPTCTKRFALKSNFEQHLRRHSGDKQFPCHICKKPFISKSEMKRHVSLHSNIRAFRCPYCEKDYKEQRVLKNHLAKSHGIGKSKVPERVKKYVCHVCPSQFFDKQKLARHLCSHTGSKPFPCNACDKKFTDKSYLKHHVKTAHIVNSDSALQ